MIQVLNRHTFESQGVYVGRPSPLGNPYVIGRNGTREDVIRAYQQWLREQWRRCGPAKAALLRLAKQHKSSGRLVLICSCAPKPCHAEVVKGAILGIVAKGLA